MVRGTGQNRISCSTGSDSTQPSVKTACGQHAAQIRSTACSTDHGTAYSKGLQRRVQHSMQHRAAAQHAAQHAADSMQHRAQHSMQTAQQTACRKLSAHMQPTKGMQPTQKTTCSTDRPHVPLAASQPSHLHALASHTALKTPLSYMLRS